MTPPFLGPVFTEDGPLLVEGVEGRRGTMREAHRRATRVVVDDYGNAVCYERRCSTCYRWRPLDYGYFAPRSDTIAFGLQHVCKACVGLWQFVRRRDPARSAGVREMDRMNYRLRAERGGRPLSSLRRMSPVLSVQPELKEPRLPLAPLVRVIERRLSTLDLGMDDGPTRREELASIGLNQRTWFSWTHGEQTVAEFGALDAVVSQLALNPWDVWRPEDDPDAYALAARLWGFDAQAVA